MMVKLDHHDGKKKFSMGRFSLSNVSYEIFLFSRRIRVTTAEKIDCVVVHGGSFYLKIKIIKEGAWVGIKRCRNLLTSTRWKRNLKQTKKVFFQFISFLIPNLSIREEAKRRWRRESGKHENGLSDKKMEKGTIVFFHFFAFSATAKTNGVNEKNFPLRSSCSSRCLLSHFLPCKWN